ncbi:MAG: diacylglycerol/lipid kinase family protein [Gemmatimonadota bacterium]
MRPFVIVNPAAGRGRPVPGLERGLRDLSRAEVRVTESPGDAARWAREAARSGCGPLLLAGGDGLLHEVVNALVPLSERPLLGLIPTGTGNDFARSLGIPLLPEPALGLLAGGRTRAVDAVRLRVMEGGRGRRPPAEGGAAPAEQEAVPAEKRAAPGGEKEVRYMVNVAVTGFAGRVARRTTGTTKRRWGGWAYRRASASELLRLSADRTELEVDGEALRLSTYAVAVANGRYVGGGIPLLSEARPDDGWLDLLVVPALPAAAVAALLPRILFGRHAGSHRLIVRRARCIRLRAEGGLGLNVDGENVDAGAVEFELLPAALRFLVPPAA